MRSGLPEEKDIENQQVRCWLPGSVHQEEQVSLEGEVRGSGGSYNDLFLSLSGSALSCVSWNPS